MSCAPRTPVPPAKRAKYSPRPSARCWRLRSAPWSPGRRQGGLPFPNRARGAVRSGKRLSAPFRSSWSPGRGLADRHRSELQRGRPSLPQARNVTFYSCRFGLPQQDPGLRIPESHSCIPPFRPGQLLTRRTRAAQRESGPLDSCPSGDICGHCPRGPRVRHQPGRSGWSRSPGSTSCVCIKLVLQREQLDPHTPGNRKFIFSLGQ